MNILVLSSGADGDEDTVVKVHNAKSERHAMACAVEHRTRGGELNMALVMSYALVAQQEDGDPTEETDGANRPEPPADQSTEWECPR